MEIFSPVVCTRLNADETYDANKKFEGKQLVPSE
jgi:hypothetical protein